MSNKKIITRRDISRKRANLWEIEERNKNKQVSQETIERKRINCDIIEKISEGKGKIEILAFLNNKYPDSEFSKYFETWYDHHKEKENSRKHLNDFTR